MSRGRGFAGWVWGEFRRGVKSIEVATRKLGELLKEWVKRSSKDSQGNIDDALRPVLYLYVQVPPG